MKIKYVVIYDDLFHLSSSTALYSLLFDANSMHEEKKIEIMLFSIFKRHSDAK